jgi:hypothetical protein
MKWNFAYGSNMHPERLRGRADITPKRCAPAVLRDWRLAFNLATGLQLVEPAMANIMPASGEEVHGVALAMSLDELMRLQQSEGGPHFYDLVDVEVETYDGEPIVATAFVAREEVTRNEVPPSVRYLRLIRDGARHHGLDEAYRAFLEDHPAAPANALSPWVMRLFRMLEKPKAHRARDAALKLFGSLALWEARLAKLREWR